MIYVDTDLNAVTALFSALVLGVPWVPLAMGAGSLLGSLFGGRNKDPQPPQMQNPRYFSPTELGVPRDSPMFNYLSTGILPGSDQDRVSTSSTRGGSSSSSRTESSSSTRGFSNTTPTYSGGSQRIVDMLPALMERQLARGGAVSPEERMGVMNAVGRQAEQLKQGLTQSARERGMGLSEPITTQIDASVGGAKMAQLANYLTSIPGVERGRRNEDLGLMSSVLQGLFKGTSTNYGSDTSGVSTTVGGSSNFSDTRNVQQGQAGGVFDPSAVGYTVRNPAPTGGGGRGTNFFDILGGASNLYAGIGSRFGLPGYPGPPPVPTPPVPAPPR